MNSLRITLSLLFISVFGFSQNIRFEGVVRDTLGMPLEMANVMAINQETKTMDGYGITNDKGRFQFSLKANNTYKVKVSFIGFQSLEETVVVGFENVTRVFTLKEGGMMLDGVEVVQEMPVSISGDTIIYNADSFKTGTEQKLEDVLKKLPGVQVNEDGEIEVEGRRVSQLLVEGKKFFEGDTKLGSKNIPSNAVDKVQVIRNFNEVSQLKGLENNEEDIAINIKLKKGKEKFWFGDVTVGGGPDERFLINPKIFYYSPKTSVNVLSNFNNTGDVPFSNRDFFRLTGGNRNTIGRSGTNIGISANSLGLSTAQNDRAAQLDTQFGAVNIAQQITNKWNVSGFGVLSSNKTITDTRSESGIFRPNTTEVETRETRTDISNFRNNLAIFKFGSKYKASPDLQIDYDASIRRSNQQEENIVSSNEFIFTDTGIVERNNNIASFKRQDPIAFNQSLNAFWTKNPRHTFVLEMQHLYQDEDPFYNPTLDRNPFPQFGFDPNVDIFSIQQERFVKTNRLDAKLDHYFTVSKKAVLNITLGNTYVYQSFNSAIFQLLDDGSRFQVPNAPEFNLNNDVQYNFNDAYLGVHYKFILGKFTFNPGVNFHRFNMFNEQLGSRVRDDFYRVLPDVFAQWQIKKSQSMTYTYRMTNFFNDINTLVEGYTFNNFNVINSGNRFIENALQETHNLRYFNYNLFNFTTLGGNVFYTRITDPVVNRAFFNGINQISESVNANFSNDTFGLNGFYQRQFAKFYRISLNANYNWNKTNQLFVDRNNPTDPSFDSVNTFESFNQSYNMSFGTQFREFPNIETGYRLSINENPNTTFVTQTPFVRLEYLFKGFIFSTDYSYSDFSTTDGSIKNTFDLLSGSIVYRKKDAKWEYRLTGTNLLNTQTILRDSFNVVRFSSNEFQILPRYIIAALRYNL
jgi:hypothetical protein